MSDAYLPVFKTISLGLYRSLQEYRKALKSGKCRLDAHMDEMLEKIEISPERLDLHLVVLSVAELGFRTFTPYEAIRTRVKEVGLRLFPAEAGPALRL